MKNYMKTNISAVKNEIEDKILNSISAVSGHKFHGSEDKRWPIRIETGNQCFKERKKAGQAEFEERVTCTLDTVEERDNTSRTAGTRTPG
jgi:hypothetical protein